VITRDVQITKKSPKTEAVVTTGISPITAIVPNIEGVPITAVIVATENVHMIRTAITIIRIIWDAGIPIRVIGGPGTNGIGTQDSTLTYTNTEDTIAKADI